MSPSRRLINLARHFRKNPTRAEALLWRHLRDDQIEGASFRRQQPIGNYIVDFYCPAAHLIIEIDGDSHDFSASHDEERDAFMEREGYRVLRFTNQQVHQRLNDVLQTIYDAMHGAWPDGDTRL